MVMDDLLKELKKWIKDGINIDPNINIERILGRIYEISVLGKIYNIEYVVSLTSNNERIFEFKFKLINNPKSPKRSNFKTDQQYKIALQKSQVGITGTGDAKKVFDSVVSVILKIIKKEQPEYITFQANEKNRQKLYKLIINDVIKKINGYRTINKHPITSDILESGEFWIKKI